MKGKKVMKKRVFMSCVAALVSTQVMLAGEVKEEEKPAAPAAKSGSATAGKSLKTPRVTDVAPGPGLRVKQVNKDYEGTGVHHALYLPTDWVKGKKYPVIVEFPAAEWRGHLDGKVESCNLGYGISGGNGAIWVCIPCVDNEAKQNALKGYGDVVATVDYCKATVARICAEFGGDASNVFLVGYGRGAAACNRIGLNDDAIAALWRGFVCGKNYDGGWSFKASKEDVAGRLKRLGSRPQFICAASVEGTRNQLKELCPTGNFTFLDIPNEDNSDKWVLEESQQQADIRKWFQGALKREEK